MKFSPVSALLPTTLLLATTSAKHPASLTLTPAVQPSTTATTTPSPPLITANLKKHPKPTADIEALAPPHTQAAKAKLEPRQAGFPEGVEIPFEPEREAWVDGREGKGKGKPKEGGSSMVTRVRSLVAEKSGGL
ncbi:hypothetical protein NX059_006540 [Plenodomus lindquistii]|nr:hypothetical protein NX059_006540 [Plenodomus lindquistii]